MRSIVGIGCHWCISEGLVSLKGCTASDYQGGHFLVTSANAGLLVVSRLGSGEMTDGTPQAALASGTVCEQTGLLFSAFDVVRPNRT